MFKEIKIALIQQKIEDNLESNLKKTINNIKRSVKEGAQLILLSELHQNLYFCQSINNKYFELADSIPGNLTKVFSDLAKSLSVVIVISIFEKRLPGVFHNTAVVIEKDGSIAGKYRKMHIPYDEGYYEKYYFSPGDLGYSVINTSVGRLGLLICWDQWFPEAARLSALNGAEILLMPTAIGWEYQDSDDNKKVELDAWITMQRSHAIANCIPVAVCNRVGFEGNPTDKNKGIDFWGSSFISGANGQLLYQASTKEDEIYIQKIVLDNNGKLQQKWQWQFFRDRRIDSYSKITKLTNQT
jgi:N-carbamoylputrescine amidase